MLPNADQVELAEAVRVCGRRAAAARVALEQAMEQSRLTARMAIASGFTKVDVAEALQVSRPTLDAWLAERSEGPKNS